MARFSRQRQAAGTDGSVTTLGYVPNKPRRAFQSGGGSSVSQYRVHTDGANTLICRSYSVTAAGVETVGTVDVEIAKPIDLQPATFDGFSFDGRTYLAYSNTGKYNWRKFTITGDPTASGTLPALPLADGSTVTETFPVGAIVFENVWPEYVPDRTIIFAASPTESIKAGVTLIDLNIAARRWEMMWRPISICVDNADGTTSRKLMLIRGSQPYE